MNYLDPDAGAEVYREVAQITLEAMLKDKGSEVDCLCIGLAAIWGALKATAFVVGRRNGIDHTSSSEDQESTLNPTTALVTALLAARAGIDTDKYLHMTLNPGIYLSAILAAENILGRKPDDLLNPGLAQAARKWEQEVGPSFWGEKISEDKPRRGALN